MITTRLPSILIILFSLIQSSGCNLSEEGSIFESTNQAKEEQLKDGIQSDVALAKKIIREYSLTEIPISCLKFENIEKVKDFKTVVEVRELHNESCKGDVLTSPRLFSIAFDENNRVWSDAKSLLGQLEPLH
jgi:hypothetical protein